MFFPFLFFFLFSSSFALEQPRSKDIWTLPYCSTDKISSWNVGEVQSFSPSITDIHIYGNKSTTNLGYLAYDPSKNIIFLIFRGKLDISIINWVQNLTPFDKCDGCSVPEGFYLTYNNLKPENIINDVKALYAKYPTAKVVVSGHSLGGAMAYFGYLDVCEAIGKVDLFITYGSPRVGNQNFQRFFQAMKCGSKKIRVVNDRDPTPHGPPTLFWNFHGYSEVFYNDGSSEYTFCQDAEDLNCLKQLDLSAIVCFEEEMGKSKVYFIKK